MPANLNLTPSPAEPPLEALLADFLQLAQSVARLQPAAGACPRQLESQLQALQQQLIVRFATMASQRTGFAPTSRIQAARFRRQLFGCEIAIRSQQAGLTDVLLGLNGNEAEALSYRPDAARRSSPGAWMNMRSAP